MKNWLTQRVPFDAEVNPDGDRYIFVPRWQALLEYAKPFIGALLAVASACLLVYLSR